MKDYEIGVMQGRLLPKYQGRYQAHPVGYWQKEFSIANELGLDLIEFILDYYDYMLNPLLNERGLTEIIALTDSTGVRVKSICADYFMEVPLHNNTAAGIAQAQEVLKTLIVNSSRLGVKSIVIPCVDKSTFDNKKSHMQDFINNIAPLIAISEKYHINLALETDLAPEPFAELLHKIDSPVIKVNYDTGNSAALGYKPDDEFAAYGEFISDIHIKDRKLGGDSLELGHGDTDFERVFSCLAHINYRGILVMQAYRDDEGLEVFKKQLEWIKPHFEKFERERG